MSSQNKSNKNSVRGKVKQFQTQQQGNGSLIIWRFLLIQFDAKHNQLPPTPVQYRGVQINGMINEGDDVEVFGKKESTGIINAKKIYNHSSNSIIEAKQNTGCLVFIILIFVAFIILIISIVIRK